MPELMQVFRLKLIEECDEVGSEEEFFSTFEKATKRMNDLYDGGFVFARIEVEMLEVN